LDDKEKLLQELNPQSIQILMDIGYDFDLIIKALLALRENKKYSPIGEV
jgi:hypothetical protein